MRGPTTSPSSAARAARRALPTLLVAGCLALAGCGDDGQVAGGEYGPTSTTVTTATGGPGGCVPNVLPSTAPTPPGTSTTALGAQPAGYELRAPASRPRGVVILLHGGGWTDVGPGQIDQLEDDAAQWLGRGWATANLDYRACGHSFDDVLRMHDAIRRLIGPRTPIVVVGESAGAQLALVLAARRPRSISAVVAKAPPTDADTLATGVAYDAQTGGQDSAQPALLAQHWRAAFGSRTASVSPALLVDDIRARVLVTRSVIDPLIPQGQVDDFAQALVAAHPRGWVRALDLPAGTLPFPHATVSADGLATYEAAVADEVAPWEGPRHADDGVPSSVPGWWPAGG